MSNYSFILKVKAASVLMLLVIIFFFHMYIVLLSDSKEVGAFPIRCHDDSIISCHVHIMKDAPLDQFRS